MAYINIETKVYPVSEQDIRLAYPNTSFSVPFQAPEEYAPVLNSPRPTVPNPVLQFARETTPQLDELGNWMQQFEVVDIYSDYTDSEGVLHTKAKQEAEAIARDEAQKKASNKARAEQMLKESDWYEGQSVSDSTKSIYLSNINEIMDYRMALRMIAVNPPMVVENWPVKPDNIWVTNE